MEIGKLFMSMILIVVSIIAISIYIMINWQVNQTCNTNLTGSSGYVLGSLKNCVELCWSKHNFGKDAYNDDCYVVDITLDDTLQKDAIESSLSSSARTISYFDFLDSGTNYKIKVRYNYTGQEISLINFEMS